LKGIVLAGGSGTRLYPMTLAVCKQLLPVYDKPMIYYPLSVLMLAGIREILLITTPHDLSRFQALLGDGAVWGLQISYAVQERPEGIAQAVIIAASFIGTSSIALILGDNIFYGERLEGILADARLFTSGAHIFGYEVKDPERYGVLAFNSEGEPVDILEKPAIAPSSFAVTGLYFYDSQVIEIARSLTPSARGELEITDVNRIYLQNKQLHLSLLGRGFAWLDTGTCEALQQAAQYVQTIQARQGIKIACLEEIAYQMGYIDEEALLRHAHSHSKTEYGAYLSRLITIKCVF